jgi:hypothetical protein
MPSGDGPRVNIFVKDSVGIPGNKLLSGESIPSCDEVMGCDGLPGP